MLPGELSSVDAHYRRMQGMQAVAVKAGRKAWSGVNPDELSPTWRRALVSLVPIVAATQERAAEAGGAYIGRALAEQGTPIDPQGTVVPGAFAGRASDGRRLDGLLYTPITVVKRRIRDGAPVSQALESGGNRLDTILRTEIAYAGRDAAGVGVAVRPGAGYVRMLNPPSCPDCLILAGRWYRYSSGFERHPRCDCVHVPSRENVAGDLLTDPRRYFDSLDAAEQDRLFGEHDAQAIRDGADMNRVVNLRMPKRRATDARARLTPEDIYTRAGSRSEAIRLLQINGYIRAT